MKFQKQMVIRTLSRKYQLTIPKRFGRDLGLEPPLSVIVRKDPQARQIIIQPIPLVTDRKAQLKSAFIEACRLLGKKWTKLGVSENDIQSALSEYRKSS